MVFAAGAVSAARNGTISSGEEVRYVLDAAGGQIMQVNLTSYQASLDLTVSAPNGSVFAGQPTRSEYYDNSIVLILPDGGDYVVTLAAHGSTTDYDIEFGIESQDNPERIRFASGTYSATRSGTVPSGGTKRYVLAATARQIMWITLTSYQAPLDLTVAAPNGTIFLGRAMRTETHDNSIVVQLPTGGDYVIALAAANTTDYDIAFIVDRLNAPEQVQFAADTTSDTRSGSFQADGVAKVYVLRAIAGQTLDVRVSSNTRVTFAVQSPRARCGPGSHSAWTDTLPGRRSPCPRPETMS